MSEDCSHSRATLAPASISLADQLDFARVLCAGSTARQNFAIVRPMERLQRIFESAVNWAGARNLFGALGRKHSHPIFDVFPPIGEQPNVDTDYLGVRTQAEMLPVGARSPAFDGFPPPPRIDEEYFEWIDVLEAAQAASGQFTMIEVGAGYGRWAMRGWRAAQRLGKEAKIVLVEADPQHLAWAKSHLAFNGVPDGKAKFVEAAVSPEVGTTTFVVEMPPGDVAGDLWYGPALAWDKPVEGGTSHQTYHGRPLLDLPNGWRGIEVATLPLSVVLHGEGVIDLVDLDIQGAESAAIAEAIEPLTAKVRRLHIGTHGRDIEVSLRRSLSAAGWRLVRSYACQRWNWTRFGWVRFGDGVQTWVNPKLA